MLRTAQHDVASAALPGATFEEIERRVIDGSACSAVQRDALRLYAWSFMSRFEQRRIALERLLESRDTEQEAG